MEELVSSKLRVVLSIKEGKGFEQVLQATSVVANLNGHSLETEAIESCANPQYMHDLVWEVEKNLLRKMRSAQTPLKLECFAMKTNDNKEKLGYLLLGIRAAQIVPRNCDVNVKANWHKLLGLKSEFRSHKPELLLALSIQEEEQVSNTQLELVVTRLKQKSPNISKQKIQDLRHFHNHGTSMELQLNNFEEQSNKVTPVLLHNERLIQLGPINSCHELFLMSITLISATNVDPLIPKEYYAHVKDNLIFWCKVLENDVHFKSSKKDQGNVWMLNEKIVIRIRSSLNVLKEYFQSKPYFFTYLRYKNDIIGQSEIDLSQLIPTDNIQEFIKITENNATLDQRCLLYKKDPNEASEQYRNSYLDLQLKLQYVGVKTELKAEGPNTLFNSKNDVTATSFQNDIAEPKNVFDVTSKDRSGISRVVLCNSDKNLGPPILDDNLAYKIVDELETWKDRQKEIFKSELKRKEEHHLNLLSNEWQKQRESLESKLACSVEQCKMLANSLNNATEDLRTRRLKSLEKEARLIKANEDLQWRYDMKTQELKESFRIMQEELTAKINVLEQRKVALETQIEPLTSENEKFRLLVAKQSEELETYKKGFLTQDQTATLLQELKALEEKLHNAQKSKSFFKEEWAKAVREIHRMKTEHQQAIQVQIKNSKEEIQNLDLEEILSADSTALTNDQILLGQIQREIDVIKPKPSFMERDSYNQVFTPVSGMSSKHLLQSNKTMSKKSEENDERLQALMEERDALLKTGSYTIDDAIIVKLNTEIRSLMMS